MLTISKYFYITKLAIIRMSAYPTRFWGAILADLIIFLFVYFLWTHLYLGKTSVNGYTLKMMITYYLITLLIGSFTLVRGYANRISKDIKSGDASLHFIKPFQYKWVLFADSIGWAIPPFLILLGIVLLLYGIQFQYLLPPHNLLLFSLSAILGTILNFLIISTAGTIAFWTTTTGGFISLLTRFSAMLGGSLVPLSFFPQHIQAVLNYLPFKYTHYVSLEIYLGNLKGPEELFTMGIQLLWILIFLIISKFIWNKGYKAYEAVNG